MESIEQRARTLVSKMTLDEKIAQIGSYWMFDLQTDGELDGAKLSEKLRSGIGQITRLAGASTLDPLGAARASNRMTKQFPHGRRTASRHSQRSFMKNAAWGRW